MLIFQSLKLIFALSLALFLPGYFLVRAIDLKSKIPALQKLTLSFGLSIFITDFLFLFMNRIGIPLSFWPVFVSFLLFIFVAFLLNPKFKSQREKPEKINRRDWLIIFLIFFAIIIRIFFLSERLLPQTTDLGHHMYWSQYIIQFQHLPNYGMPDFIIGEHIVFSAVSILSGIGIISSMPIAILFLVNIFSVLACFIAAFELARCFTKRKNAYGIAVLTLFSIGILYATSSPQAKYISGGVIGNTIGNLMIPLSFFLLIKFARTRLPRYSVFFIMALATLAYTHHLSSFIFLYSFGGFLILVAGSFFVSIFSKQAKFFFKQLWRFLKDFFNWKTLLSLLIFIFFVFFVRTPSYLNPSAIDTAVGDPSKDTRTGLALGSIIETAGPWRFFYGAIGAIALAWILSITLKNKPDKNFLNKLFSVSVLLGWGLMIFLMSYAPQLLKVDIPSNRVGSYITFPFAFLSAIGVFYLFHLSKNKTSKKIFAVFAVTLIGTGIVSGMAEISANKKAELDNKDVYQTYAASYYLKDVALENEQILKDHIYLGGDSWIKIFFMRDYKYPLSRSFLKRYDDPVKPRETCTRDMIGIPDSEIGKKCFEEYGVKYIMLKKGYDTAQFERSENFSKIFANNQVVIFEKN